MASHHFDIDDLESGGTRNRQLQVGPPPRNLLHGWMAINPPHPIRVSHWVPSKLRAARQNPAGIYCSGGWLGEAEQPNSSHLGRSCIYKYGRSRSSVGVVWNRQPSMAAPPPSAAQRVLINGRPLPEYRMVLSCTYYIHTYPGWSELELRHAIACDCGGPFAPLPPLALMTVCLLLCKP